MRVLPIAFLLLLLATPLAAVKRAEVRKRFVLKLIDEPLCGKRCVTKIKSRVKRLRFHGKHARCRVLRHNKMLRMLSVRCGIVDSAKTAMLLNAHFKAIYGVELATQDALITSRPSRSRARDAADGTGPDTPMFRPASRMRRSGDLLPYNWGLDRLDEDYSPLDNLPVDFSCYPKQGSGVHVFVIDTGCRTDHDEFSEARVTTRKAPGSSFKNGWDNHGHGTHIAGVIVGKNVGVARRADVTCIKAFDEHGQGAATDTISAVEYILEEKAKNASVPFVVNLSYSALTGFMKTALDEIVYASSAHGIVFAVSAGNAAVNSCLFSPSKAEQAFTVTASTKRDTLEVDSNIGPCVEFIAPGHEIVSAGIESIYDYESLNGTSMATPHIVGLSALVLAENLDLQEAPETVRDTLYQKLVMTRTARVANYIMPLMEIGCASPVPGAKRGNLENRVHAQPSPIPTVSCSPSPSPSASPSPSGTPGMSPSPSASISVSPSASPLLKVGSKRYWRRKKAMEMEADLSRAPPEQSAKAYYHHGLAPHR